MNEPSKKPHPDGWGFSLAEKERFARLRAGRVAALGRHWRPIHYRSLRISLNNWPEKIPRPKTGDSFWRRRRDSNSRDPFGAYAISSRARSTKLRDFSTFCSAGGRYELGGAFPTKYYNRLLREMQAPFSAKKAAAGEPRAAACVVARKHQ